MRPAHLTPRRIAAAVLAGLAALATPGSARAEMLAPVSIGNSGTSTEGLGSFTGTVTVDRISPTSATVTFQLTNTTSSGYITGFAFNLPTGVTGALLTAAVPTTFSQIGGGTTTNSVVGDFNDVAASPYGYFDVGAAVGNGSFNGGGATTTGISSGQKGTFTFQLSSTATTDKKGNTTYSYDLSQLTAQILFNTLSYNPQGGGAQPFVVRFRGITTGAGSDKVIGSIGGGGGGGGGNNPVPAPPAVLLALAGVGSCLLGRGFRRRLTAKTA